MTLTELNAALETQGVYAGKSIDRVHETIDLKSFEYALHELAKELSNPIPKLQDKARIGILRTEIKKIMATVLAIIEEDRKIDAEYVELRKGVEKSYSELHPKIISLVNEISEFLEKTNGLNGSDNHRYSSLSVLKDHLTDEIGA